MRAQPSDGCPRLLYRTALALTALDLIGKSRAKAMPVPAIRAGQALVPLRWNHLWKGPQGRADAALVRNTPSLMSGGGDTLWPRDGQHRPARPPARWPAGDAPRRHVVIVGAGIAGLTAGMLLKEAAVTNAYAIHAGMRNALPEVAGPKPA